MDTDDPVMINSFYEALISELLIDPVKVSHEIVADLEEMGWPEEPPPQTQEILLQGPGWPRPPTDGSTT